MKIYLSARYRRFQEMQLYASTLEKIGHKVVSSWINGAHEARDNDVSMWRKFAEKDMEELKEADCLVAFTEHPDSDYARGGRHVELGMAIVWGKEIWVVGYIENVFCALPQINFAHSVGDLFVELQMTGE